MKTDQIILALTAAGFAVLFFVPELFLFASGTVLILQAIMSMSFLSMTYGYAKAHNLMGIWRKELLTILSIIGVGMGSLIWLPELYLFIAGLCLLAQGYVAARSMYLQWTAPDRPVVSLLQLEYRQ